MGRKEMIKKTCLLMAVILMILFSNDITVAQNLREGLWEITVRMEMEEGMPVKMPAQTIR
ncbi:MAG: hypothetical protein QXY90_06770 [Candidatus Anstonellales archaeon]